MSAERIASVLADTEIVALKDLASWIGGGECEGSKFHSPRPLLVRPHHLSDLSNHVKGVTDQDTGLDLVWLCSTCFDNLTVYVSILVAYDGATPQSVRRDFGNVICTLGDRAWQHHLNRSEGAPV